MFDLTPYTKVKFVTTLGKNGGRHWYLLADDGRVLRLCFYVLPMDHNCFGFVLGRLEDNEDKNRKVFRSDDLAGRPSLYKGDKDPATSEALRKILLSGIQEMTKATEDMLISLRQGRTPSSESSEATENLLEHGRLRSIESLVAKLLGPIQNT